MSVAVPALLIFGSIAAGFAWGRISSRLPIPEMLRLLTTPLWTGALMVIVGWLAGVAHHAWNAPRFVDAARLGAVSALRSGLGYCALLFFIGAALGLPAAIGWVFGYRRTDPLHRSP